MIVDFSGVTEIIFASKDTVLTKLIIENKTLGNKVLWEKTQKVGGYAQNSTTDDTSKSTSKPTS